MNYNQNANDPFKDGKQQARESARDFKQGYENLVNSQENKKVLAGLLGIFLGGLGVHKFVLGYTQEGIIQLVFTFFTCGVGQIIGVIEGIIYLTKSDEEFYQTYQVGKKPWF